MECWESWLNPCRLADARVRARRRRPLEVLEVVVVAEGPAAEGPPLSQVVAEGPKQEGVPPRKIRRLVVVASASLK